VLHFLRCHCAGLCHLPASCFVSSACVPACLQTSVGGSESEGEGQEESEVSQQLEQIGLHEG
jgi:hypothetical protein